MKGRKIVLFFTLILILIIVGGYFIIEYLSFENTEEFLEYTPEEEITKEQLRQTIVTLYYMDKESKELVPESRIIDIKELLIFPYETLIKMLLEDPKNEQLEKIFPDDVIINKIYAENDMLVIDFSSTILNFKEENKEKMLDSLAKTLTQLVEINSIKILVDDNEHPEFSGIYNAENLI